MKTRKIPSKTPEVKEVPGALDLASQEIFHKDYLPPRMDNASPIIVPSNGKYPLTTSLVPPGVRIEGEMLSKIVGLKFMDNEITKQQKFPELAMENYFHTWSVPGTRAILLETQ
jgi:hypothetical protein